MLQKSQLSNHISTHSVEREVYKDIKGKKVTKIRFTKSGKWQDLWDNGPTMPHPVQNDHIFFCRLGRNHRMDYRFDYTPQGDYSTLCVSVP